MNKSLELLDVRNAVEKSLVANGFEVDGGGVGLGGADLFVDRYGKRYRINITPLEGNDSKYDSHVHAYRRNMGRRY